MFKDTTIVFDLDGTLVDTAPGPEQRAERCADAAGTRPVSPETIRACVGHGARVMIEEACGSAGAEDDVDRMLDDFLVHYEANIAAESRPFPGAVAALDRLAAEGARLAVCTNKRESLSRRLLQELELERYFGAIAGRNTFPVAKPDPGHLTGTIGLAGGDPTRAVMIGDSGIDLMAAKAASVPMVMVSFGYASEAVPGATPEAVIDHFDELHASLISLVRNGAAYRLGAQRA